MPPSLVVVAWSAFGSAKMARDFLADGTRGVRGIKAGLPVVVVGGKDDGEVTQSVRNSSNLWWPFHLCILPPAPAHFA